MLKRPYRPEGQDYKYKGRGKLKAMRHLNRNAIYMGLTVLVIRDGARLPDYSPEPKFRALI